MKDVLVEPVKSKWVWVDPPSGWQYGFPKLLELKEGDSLIELCRANGYPTKTDVHFMRVWEPTIEELDKL